MGRGCCITGCLAPFLFLNYPGYIADCIGFGKNNQNWVLIILPFVCAACLECPLPKLLKVQWLFINSCSIWSLNEIRHVQYGSVKCLSSSAPRARYFIPLSIWNSAPWVHSMTDIWLSRTVRDVGGFARLWYFILNSMKNLYKFFFEGRVWNSVCSPAWWTASATWRVTHVWFDGTSQVSASVWQHTVVQSFVWSEQRQRGQRRITRTPFKRTPGTGREHFLIKFVIIIFVALREWRRTRRLNIFRFDQFFFRFCRVQDKEFILSSLCFFWTKAMQGTRTKLYQGFLEIYRNFKTSWKSAEIYSILLEKYSNCWII